MTLPSALMALATAINGTGNRINGGKPALRQPRRAGALLSASPALSLRVSGRRTRWVRTGNRIADAYITWLVSVPDIA
eukprot:958018-Rhodomonas_salina.3